MANLEHAAVVAADNHVIHAMEFADASEREAVSLSSSFVGKTAKQLDDNSLWVLTNHSPMTWKSWISDHTHNPTEVGLSNVSNIKHKFDATADPGVSDDTSSGYAPGSVWINRTAGSAFECVDASAGAASWLRTTKPNARRQIKTVNKVNYCGRGELLFAIDTDGNVWGTNSGSRIIGYGRNENRSSWIRAALPGPARDVVTDGRTTFFILEDGRMYACTDNPYAGAAGVGNDRTLWTPTNVGGVAGVKKVVPIRVTAGTYQQVLTLQENGDVFLHGYNGAGGINEFHWNGSSVGRMSQMTTPLRIYEGVKDISGVGGGSYGITSFFITDDGRVVSFGFAPTAETNTTISIGGGLTQVGADTDGGTGKSGVLAVSYGDAPAVTKIVQNPSQYINYRPALALREDGTIMMTGSNTNSMCSGMYAVPYNYSTYWKDRGSPVRNAVDIASCGGNQYGSFGLVTADGDVWTWGYNAYGQLGHGDTTTRKMERVSSLSNITKLRGCGNQQYGSFFALDDDGYVYSCGYNSAGVLGLGHTTSNVYTFTKIPLLTNVVDMWTVGMDPTAGYEAMIFQTGDGRFYFTGRSNTGLGKGGNNSVTYYDVPTELQLM